MEFDMDWKVATLRLIAISELKQWLATNCSEEGRSTMRKRIVNNKVLIMNGPQNAIQVNVIVLVILTLSERSHNVHLKTFRER